MGRGGQREVRARKGRAGMTRATIRGRWHTELFKKTLCVNVEFAAEAQPSVVLFTESSLAKVGNRFARLVWKIEGKSLTPSACSVFQM
eukprot:COSAG03_NODE_2_length_28887_cov_60.449825_32_plen_88_part_00